jgi:gamma-glutamyl hercynylcysteine S-oxide synthase
MQTTGLAAERMSGLYEGDGLAAALRDARRRTLGIYAHLDLESVAFPCIPTVNPPLWELAHLAWFQEYWCLRAGGTSAASILDRADSLFDSGTVPHDSRWHLDYPPARALLRYMDDTLEATQEALVKTPEERRYFFRLALLHEDMHGEALLMTLQSQGLAAPPIESRDPPASHAQTPRDVHFSGGEFVQGTERGDFIFDNERCAHRVRVAPFAMSARPVAQGEFAQFVAATKAPAPRYWRRDGSTWQVRRFDQWAPIDSNAPMIHVALDEALAFCRWARRRLPTESEWEFAARNGGGDERYPGGDDPAESASALDFRHRGPSAALADPAPSASGLEQMLGGVWEWTSSPFAPYPGFSPDPYREYSAPWFHTHFVLRGGSFATRSRIASNRYRNFYLPGRADVFAGFRTCALEAR